MKLYIGTSGYSYAAWKGKFYPPRLAAKEMLAYYAARLGTVEINNTFYRMPTPSIIEGWAAQVPLDFQFAFKAPQRITHQRRLSGVADDTARFLEVTSGSGARCGPLLFQLPPNFQRDDTRLRDLLAILPADVRVAFEFRHPSWFDDSVYQILKAHNRALEVTDTDEAEATPITATADWGYLRLRRAEYSETELSAWLARINAQSWQESYVYFKHEDDARGPEFALRLRALAGDAAKPSDR